MQKRPVCGSCTALNLTLKPDGEGKGTLEGYSTEELHPFGYGDPQDWGRDVEFAPPGIQPSHEEDRNALEY